MNKLSNDQNQSVIYHWRHNDYPFHTLIYSSITHLSYDKHNEDFRCAILLCVILDLGWQTNESAVCDDGHHHHDLEGDLSKWKEKNHGTNSVISCETALRLMLLDLTDNRSTSVQVMAWCHQATSHYLSQCWPRSMSSYGITRSQWVNSL